MLVANDTSLLTDEKDMATMQFNESTSIYKMAQTNYDNSLKAAQTSLDSVFKAVGYQGLYKSLMSTGGTLAVSNAETVMGLQPGQMLALANDPNNTAALDTHLKQTQLAQANANLAQVPLDIAQKKAAIAASGTTAAKNAYELAYEKANGGLTPAEVQANSKIEATRIQKFQAAAAVGIQNMGAGKSKWADEWQALHTAFPEATVQTIDNALNATKYRSKYGG